MILLICVQKETFLLPNFFEGIEQKEKDERFLAIYIDIIRFKRGNALLALLETLYKINHDFLTADILLMKMRVLGEEVTAKTDIIEVDPELEQNAAVDNCHPFFLGEFEIQKFSL